VVFFGVITNVDGCLFCCSSSCSRTPTPTPAFDAQGHRIYSTRSGQFVIVVEGAPGASGVQPGKSVQPTGADGRPDVQIENTRDLGNGSPAVCDTGPASSGGGGIPGINPVSFQAADSVITDALNDFACRFEQFSPGAPCTFVDASGEARLVNGNATIQFCDFAATTALFPPGDSLLSVRLRDTLGNLGPTAQVVVRVATPTPRPPAWRQ
jgi:hypothetical protein